MLALMRQDAIYADLSRQDPGRPPVNFCTVPAHGNGIE
jgi:hypothetical protein